MKLAIILLIASSLGLGLWGCPTKKNLPDPTPPEPEMQIIIPTGLEVRAFYDELLSLEGRAPHIGVRVEPLILLASLLHGAFIDIRNPAGQRDVLHL